MKHVRKVIFSTFLLLGFCIHPVYASFTADISLSESSIHFSQDRFLEGNPVRIYATVYNASNNDLLGTVQFYDETAGKQIGSDQTISIFSNKTDDIFVDWTPYFEGQHTISINIDPWITKGDDSSNNSTKKTITVLKDTDYDGITDSEDPDDDNDGYLDNDDMFPLDASEWVDTDGDRKGDNSDEDDDNDGHLDEEDTFPLNSLEWEDIDEDGTGNNEDEDDDNDGLSDLDEEKIGSDPLKADTDEDSILDGEDAFPLDPKEQYDFDKDRVGDNADNDDDNDGILDEQDVNDHNKGPHIKIDRKGTIAFLNREYKFDASRSFDEDGEIKELQWIINEKESKFGDILNYTFENLGKYSIKIIALDDKDESRELEFEIYVFDLDFYLITGLIVIIILLAIVIILKYSSLADIREQ